jgi:23S rRNA (adenine-N6)-dimethyltransferase
VSAERTRWGWHQLSSHWAAQIVADSGVKSGDLVLDVGAGSGALVRPLLDRGAHVVAFELHPGRASGLRRTFAGERVTVVVADASDLWLPRRPFRVVANPPFAIGMALLRRLVSPASRLMRADVVVPLHMAHRWVSGRAPGARRWRASFSADFGRPLPRRALSPPPPNGVAVLVIRRR